MKIIELLKDEKLSLSFEVFPPKVDSSFESVKTATEKIAKLKPAFMSVTYGAGGGIAGQLAVGAVVINRVLSGVFPDTVVGVVYQKNQFSPVASGRLALALSQNKATASCYQAADEAMAGVTNVGGCVYFRTPIPGLTGIQIGGHIFY